MKADRITDKPQNLLIHPQNPNRSKNWVTSQSDKAEHINTTRVYVGVYVQIIPSLVSSHCMGSSSDEFCERTVHIAA